jgi:multidrug efflux pump subunit AcrB
MLLLSPIESVARFFDYVRDRAACGLTILTEQYYVPTLRWILVNPVTAVAGCIAMLLVCGGLIAGGLTPFVYFPKLDDEVIRAVVVYPHGTPAAVTEAAARRLEDAALAVAREYSANGTPVVNTVFRLGGQIEGFTEFEAREGSHLGQVQLELAPSGEREVRSREFIARWRDLAGEFPGAVELTFAGVVFGPGGKPIEFKILGTDLRLMDAAVERIKSRLASYPGVFDVRDDHQPGKWERRLSIRPEATAMGIRLADLAETVRASYHGEEVMRLQRGRHEVKLMVRYPPQERKSLANFDEIHVRTPSGDAVPLPVLAQVDVVRGVSQITRFNQLRSITVTADLDEQTANARQIVDDLQTNFVPAFLREFPGVSILWEGQQQDTTKAFASLSRGFAAAIFVNYVLLTLQFRSCLQPLLVLITVPFGMIGAVLGHLLLGLPLTMFTMFGLVALAGVVVNDAILLIDFINRRWVAETDLTAALIESGRQRVRPILLTSVTTIGGLCPIMLEKSVQAQVLTPMAVSLSFGLMFSTVWVLLLLPALYRIYAAVPGVARAFQREAAEMASPSSPAVPQP